MPISSKNVVRVSLTDVEIQKCIDNSVFLCATIKDRSDLHLRSYMERYIDIMMGEVAENAVIDWFINNGKYAISAVDKKSGTPDLGHDIILKDRKGREILCSIKSSLSAYKSNIDDILDTFTIATTAKEVRKVNIQVYYWLKLGGKVDFRTTVPSNENMAIIGWIGENDIKKFEAYKTEKREAANTKLRDIRPMQSLLQLLS